MSESPVRTRPGFSTDTAGEEPRTSADRTSKTRRNGADEQPLPRATMRKVVRRIQRNRLTLVQRVKRLSVGRKLLLIYIVGIFVPLVVANGLVLRSVVRDARLQQEGYVHTTVENLQNDLIREVEPIIQVSGSIYSDATIYRLLAARYDNFVDYLTVYRDFLLPALTRYLSVYPDILQIIIYTNNETIGASTGYVSMNAYVRSSEWLAQFAERDWRMVVMHHTDADPRLEMRPEEYTSLFRYLNNPVWPESGQMILRIDINPTVLSRNLADAGVMGRVEVVDPWGVVVISQDNDETTAGAYAFDMPVTGSAPLEGWSIRGEIVPFGEPLTWSTRWTFLLGISGLSIAISSLFILLLSRSVISRLHSLSQQMHRVEREDFSPLAVTPDSQDEVDHLITDYNMMARKIDSLINDRYKSEIERNELVMAGQQAELNALQSQVNPHFLFNALESIRMRSHIRGEHETARVIKLLSHMFRRLAGWGDDMIALREELRFTREYIEIQQYRFGDRLKAEFSVDTGVADLLVPKLTIQGLVENALVHGLEGRTDGGTVWVTVSRTGNRLAIRVSDDGVGCDPTTVRRALVAPRTELPTGSTHIGMANLYRRLRLHFGERLSFSFESKPDNGTVVQITIEDVDEFADSADG